MPAIMDHPSRPKARERKTGGLAPLIVFVLIGIFGLVMLHKSREEILVLDEEELLAQLPEHLRKQMERELDELEDAEQYVLRAKNDGDFPCFGCPGSRTIFLRKGEIWHYGATRKREKGRYPDDLNAINLTYIVQYRGDWKECLRQEKLKIYQYAIHPENLRRPFRLTRPPGNGRTD